MLISYKSVQIETYVMHMQRLMQMRDSLASLGAPLDVTDQSHQNEAVVPYRVISLTERYQMPDGIRAELNEREMRFNKMIKKR